MTDFQFAIISTQLCAVALILVAIWLAVRRQS